MWLRTSVRDTPTNCQLLLLAPAVHAASGGALPGESSVAGRLARCAGRSSRSARNYIWAYKPPCSEPGPVLPPTFWSTGDPYFSARGSTPPCVLYVVSAGLTITTGPDFAAQRRS